MSVPGTDTRAERGHVLLGYGLFLAFVAVACLAAMVVVGGWATETLKSIGDRL